MSVYIKGERMPKCCDECWALDDDGDYPRCRITEEQCGYTFRTREKRMSKCPLVGVKTPEELSKAKVRFEEVLDEYNISWSYGDKDKTLKTLNMFKEFIENYSINDKYVFNDTHEPSIDQEYDMTREVAQFILAYMNVHNDLESKAICMAIDALKNN